MAYQRENGTCHGRGFAGSDPSGFLAKFYTWITKPTVSGGAGWTILTDSGSAPTDPYIVVANGTPSAYNDHRYKIVKVGMLTATAGEVYFRHYLSWNPDNDELQGIWAGCNPETYDDSDFAYDFRGGDETLMAGTRLGSAWDFSLLTDWEAVQNLCEATGVIGTTVSGITAGSNIRFELQTGEATNFTSGNYYYALDLSGHIWGSYFQCVGVDVGNDYVYADSIEQNLMSGTIVGAYPHRWTHFTNRVDSSTVIQYHDMTIPYYSHPTTSYSMPDGGFLYGEVVPSYNATLLDCMNPDDNGYYAVQRPIIIEQYNRSTQTNTDNTNRAYGKPVHMYMSDTAGMSQMLDGRTINGSGYIYVTAYSTAAILMLDEDVA